MADKSLPTQPVGRKRQRRVADPVNMRHTVRQVTRYTIFDWEFDTIGKLNHVSTVFYAFFGGALSLSIGFGFDLFLSGPDLDEPTQRGAIAWIGGCGLIAAVALGAAVFFQITKKSEIGKIKESHKELQDT